MKRNRIGKIFTRQPFPHLQKTADFEKYTEQSLKDYVLHGKRSLIGGQ